MTDPASPAAVTEERISEIRLRSTNYSPRHGHIPAMDDVAALLAAFDARGLELAKRDEEVARLKGENAQWEQNYENAEEANGVWRRVAEGFETRALAAEARLAQANEALTKARAALKQIGDHPAIDAIVFTDVRPNETPSIVMTGGLDFVQYALSDIDNPSTPPAQSAGEEEIARLKVSVEAARIAHGSAIRAAAAAEANLEKAREVLTVISTKGCAPSSQPPTQCPSCIAADYLRVTETQSAGEALDPAGTGEGATFTPEGVAAFLAKHRTRIETVSDALDALAQLEETVGIIRAQASALAGARRSALEEAANLADYIAAHYMVGDSVDAVRRVANEIRTLKEK